MICFYSPEEVSRGQASRGAAATHGGQVHVEREDHAAGASDLSPQCQDGGGQRGARE